MDAEAELATRAEGNFGVFTLAEAYECGLTSKMVCLRVEQGRFRRVASKVFVFAGVPYSWHADVTAAVRATGPRSAACRRTAAAAHGFLGFKPNVVEVVMATRAREVPRATVHRSDRFDGARTSTANGLVVTDVARTLLDLGAVVHPFKVSMAADDMLIRKRVTLTQLRDELQNAGKGYAGTACLRQLLAERPDGYVPPTPGLERRLFTLLKSKGLPLPEKQWRVDVQLATYYLDFAYPEAKIGIEAQSYTHHLGGHILDYDSERHNRLTVNEWKMLYNTSWRLKHRADEFASEVAALLDART